MYDGRILPGMLTRRPWLLIWLALACVLAWALLQPIWQPGSVTTGNCACGWPGCGCVELTLQPYTMPTAGFIPWATVVVPGLPGDPGPMATATFVATTAPQPTKPPNSQPTAITPPTVRPEPTMPTLPTTVPTLGPVQTVAPVPTAP